MVTPEIVRQAARHLGAESDRFPQETGVDALPSDEAALRAWLARRVAHLLGTHPALLMSHLYRVDVRERDVQAALAAPDPPAALADALIEREIEKARYRSRYTPPHDDAAL